MNEQKQNRFIWQYEWSFQAEYQIDAKAAIKDGIKFYIGNDKAWLCDKMPAKYIKIFSK